MSTTQSPTTARAAAGPLAWAARFITGPQEPAPLLRRSFDLDRDHGTPVSAVLRLTALGLVEAWINGVSASADVLTPGWTTYEKRLRVVEWNVTDLLAETTTVVLAVGNGWYRGRLGWLGLEHLYGPQRAASAELVVRFEDGHVQTLLTDEDWHTAPSGILGDDLYDGETIDARGLRPETAHLAPDHLFRPATVLDVDTTVLELSAAPPVRRQESVAPTVVERGPTGDLLLDFGQNLVGWLRITTTGSPGAVLTVRHAEVLENGDLATRPLRSAKATDRYLLSGDDDVFEPTFTFHGFRYVSLSGWPGTEQEAADNIRAVVIGSQLRRTGYFACSDAELNQLHQNVVWGMRGNFVGLPTDCPQRDERMAYVGDLATFAPTGSFLYDIDEFLRDWFRDVNLEQEIGQGMVPLTAPNTLKYEPTMNGSEIPEEYRNLKDFRPAPMALWQDGAVWIPWALWEQYGDRRILEQQRDSIRQYLEFVEASLDDDGRLTAGYQLGDWLDPGAPPDDPRGARADREVVATACMYRTADLAARIADVLGDADDAGRRRTLARRIRDGFLTAYVEEDGGIRSDAATVYALPIVFGMLEGHQAAEAGRRLAQLVRDSGHVISTGFIGTPFVLHALSQTGHVATAYELLTQRECPSWLYQVSMGATTIWERWDALLPDGSVNPGEMTSFNHYAFGSVADWMHRVVAGLSPLEPGYRRVLFSPRPGGGLASAQAQIETRRGTSAISWDLEGHDLVLRLEVAPGSEGVLRLPDEPDTVLEPGRHELRRRWTPYPQEALVLDAEPTTVPARSET